MRPTVVIVAGFSSNVGKTTLMCELLKRFPGWEAIKISRGHYRSCGRDPAACCVSPLLGERPTIFSDRAQTEALGKDTGRYWQAGASNVHWLICTSDQLAAGVSETLSRVQSPGVFIEGTSVLQHLAADYVIMVASPEREEVKATALRVAARVDAFYLCDETPVENLWTIIDSRLQKRHVRIAEKPVYSRENLASLAETICRTHEASQPDAEPQNSQSRALAPAGLNRDAEDWHRENSQG